MVLLKLTKSNVDRQCLPPTDPRKVQAFYWDTETRGFGLVVGRTGVKTYVLQRRGKRQTIGQHGTWTPDGARARAMELAVEIDRRRAMDPVDAKAEKERKAARRLTLAQGLEDHLTALRAKKGSPRSIKSMEDDLEKYLGDWLQRPMAQLAKSDCRERHRKISVDHGPYLANRLFRYVRAIYNTALGGHDLPAPNPCIDVGWNKEHRRQQPIPWERLPAWRSRVETLGPVRRDYLLTVLFTGLRSEDA